MTQYTISIEGFDNSGKTTLIRNTSKAYSHTPIRELFTTLDLRANDLCSDHPAEPSAIRDFFINAPIEKVVETLLRINKKKSEIIMDSESKYALLDRGFVTTIASCISRIQAREGKTFSESINLLDRINSDVGYSIVEKDFVLLSLSPQKAIGTFIARENGSIDEGYLSYLKVFSENLQKIQDSQSFMGLTIPRKHVISAENPPHIVQEEFCSLLGDITDINYELLLGEFLKELNPQNIDSVIIGGSYFRGDLIPKWSDMDAVCVLNDGADPNPISRSSEMLSSKYNIRFNPKLLHKNDLNEPYSLPFKILIFFLPDYESAAMKGEKYDLGLDMHVLKEINQNEFNNLLKFYDSLEQSYQTGNLSQEDIVLRGVRVCFNLTKNALFNEGVVISSYKDTVKKSEKLTCCDANALENLRVIRENWNSGTHDLPEIIKDIRNYVKNIRGYYKNG